MNRFSKSENWRTDPKHAVVDACPKVTSAMIEPDRGMSCMRERKKVALVLALPFDGQEVAKATL